MPSAIVTGGVVRIGRAAAVHLAKRGFGIALHYHGSTDAVPEAIEEIRSLGVACRGYACDFTDLAASEKLIETVVADFADVELLVNSAANFIEENVQQTQTQTLADTFHINLLSPYLLMREYKKLVNRGSIVNILDERILRTVPTFAAYSVTKVGLAHLTRMAAVEWGENVRVNGIAPGLILPPAGANDDYLKREAKRIPMKAHGLVDDILRGLDYLIDSPFVNGETLFIDGGQSKGPRRSIQGKDI